jgi:hypothetical protein
MTPADPTNPTGWKYRRSTVMVALVYCATTIALVLWRGSDSALNREAVNVLAILAGTIIGSYVFGAAWERVKGGP